MRICVTGTDGIGKSTFINDLKSNWSNYKQPVYSFQQLKNLRDGNFTKDKQKSIINCMFDTYKQYGKNDNVVFDRGPIDCLAYTLYGSIDGKSDIDDDFVAWMNDQVKNALRMIDLIMFIPITRAAPLDLDKNARDKESDYVTVDFIKSIDAILKSIFNQWENTQSKFIIVDDKPHFIEIFGLPQERLHLARYYIAEDGGMPGDSSIITPQEMDELEQLHKKFGIQR